MWTHAVATTAVLTMAVLLSKAAGEVGRAPAHADRAAELLWQALHWRDVAAQDGDAALRLQHLAAASATLHAARTLARDADLERASSIDVSRLARTLEEHLRDARAAVVVAPPRPRPSARHAADEA